MEENKIVLKNKEIKGIYKGIVQIVHTLREVLKTGQWFPSWEQLELSTFCRRLELEFIKN